MLVMDETSQSAMGPYVAMADAGFALKACTASFRESLLVKVRETASTVVARKSTGMRSVASFIVRPRCVCAPRAVGIGRVLLEHSFASAWCIRNVKERKGARI